MIADDHSSTREGIRMILQTVPDVVVVGEAQDGAEAQQRVVEPRPDILLLDLVMPDPRPMDIERWVREHVPETTVLILKAHDRDHFLAQAVEARVDGYLTNRRILSQPYAVQRAVRNFHELTFTTIR
ncbi:MAG: response regulator [Anaerolineae bacterium]